MLLAAYAPPGKALSIEVICFKPVKIPRPWPKPRGEVRGGAWLFDRADVSEGVLNCAESGSVGNEGGGRCAPAAILIHSHTPVPYPPSPHK